MRLFALFGLPGMDDIFKWFLERLGFGHSNAMESAMKVLDSVRNPNPYKEWYSNILGNALGLSIGFAVVAALLSATIVTLGRGQWKSLGTYLLDIVVLLWTNVWLSIAVTFGFLLSDGATQVTKAIATVGKADDASWYHSLLKLAGITDPFGNFGARWYGMLIGWGLTGWAIIIATGFFLCLVMLILTYPTRNTGKWGSRAWRWSVAGVITVIFMKPAMMFFLAFGSMLINVVPSMPGVNMQLGISLFFSTMAALSPILMFLAINYGYTKVGGRLQTWSEGGKVTTKSESAEKIRVDSATRHTANMTLRTATPHEGRVRSLRRVASHEAKMAVASKAAQASGNPAAMAAGLIAEEYLKRRKSQP